jgi:hypothetical protein
MKRNDYIAILIVLIITAIFAFSCNPVKQVLNNRANFEKVKNEVIRLGYCANDTIINNISDTLITIDTIVYVDQETEQDLSKITIKAEEYKQKAIKRLNWLILGIIGIGLFVFFKIKP